MKRILIATVGLLILMRVLANPIATPYLEISELYFEESGDWILELGYYEINQQDFPIDSILLISSTDTVRLSGYTFNGIQGFIVLRNDSFAHGFNIKPTGDSLTMRYYIMEMIFEDVLVFGDREGAVISSPLSNQSISRYWNAYSKDKSPTIGEINDTIGMCGTLSGMVYDLNNEPVVDQVFMLNGGTRFETDGFGNYTLRMISKPTSFNWLYYQSDHFLSVDIEEVAFVMEPDSSVFRDIHLLDSLLTDVNQKPAAGFPLKLYPNPLTHSDFLNYEIDLPIKTANCRVDIYTITGQLIASQKLIRSSGQIELSNATGILLVNFWMENRLLSTNRIVVLNE